MGLFNTKWIVEFEFSEGFFSSHKNGTMVVEASSEYSARRNAKAVLEANYRFVKVLSARKSGGRAEERNVSFASPINIRKQDEQSFSSATTNQQSDSPSLSNDQEERIGQQTLAFMLKTERENNIEKKKKEIRFIKIRPFTSLVAFVLLSLVAFLLGWVPYWFFDSRRQTALDTIARIVDVKGYDLNEPINDPYVLDLYEQGLQAKQMRDAIIWLPFALLGIGIAISVLVFVWTLKKKKISLPKAEKELADLIGETENLNK